MPEEADKEKQDWEIALKLGKNINEAYRSGGENSRQVNYVNLAKEILHKLKSKNPREHLEKIIRTYEPDYRSEKQ